MLSVEEATEVIRQNLPGGNIQLNIFYKGLYIFQVFSNRPFEEEMDPFFSVNAETGEFRDYSVFDDGNINEIAALFAEAREGRGP